GEPLPARESSATGGPSAARMRQAVSKKDDLMEVIADLGLVVWYFITLIFPFLVLVFSFLSVPLYKRIPERALHGSATFLAGLLACCGFAINGWREDPGRERAGPQRFLSFDSLERGCRGWGKPGRTRGCAGCARGVLPDLLGAALQFRAQPRVRHGR